MRLLKQILSIIIIPMLLLLIGYYINLEKPDVIYTLSENIPISITGEESSKSIQQLEVKNVGNSESRDIKVKISKEVVSHEIIKYSQADSPEVFESSNAFELNYSLLPPEGSFRLIFNTIGEGINLDDLKIQHLKGNAEEALSRNESIFIKYLPTLAFLTYLVIFIIGLRFYFVYNLLSDSKYRPEDFLKRKKPFYVSLKYWEDIRKKLINNDLFNSLYYLGDNLEDYLPYKYLKMSKPKYLSEEEWWELIKNASKIFEEKVELVKNMAKHSEQLLPLLDLNRPSNYKENKWDNFINEVNKKYLILKKFDILNYPSLIESEFNTIKPLKLTAEIWNEYVKFLNDEYYSKINAELLQISNPFDYLKDIKLDYLSKEKIDKLNNRTYKLEYIKLFNIVDVNEAKKYLKSSKPDWISTKDYKEIRSIADQIVNIDYLKNKYEMSNNIVRDMINNKNTYEDKPNCIDDTEWQNFLGLKSKIIEIEKLNKLKDIIEKQLSIINEFLSDPTVLNRIEEYNNVFAPGNFDNLKKIAHLVSENKKI